MFRFFFYMFNLTSWERPSCYIAAIWAWIPSQSCGSTAATVTCSRKAIEVWSRSNHLLIVTWSAATQMPQAVSSAEGSPARWLWKSDCGTGALRVTRCQELTVAIMGDLSQSLSLHNATLDHLLVGTPPRDHGSNRQWPQNPREVFFEQLTTHRKS